MSYICQVQAQTPTAATKGMERTKNAEHCLPFFESISKLKASIFGTQQGQQGTTRRSNWLQDKNKKKKVNNRNDNGLIG